MNKKNAQIIIGSIGSIESIDKDNTHIHQPTIQLTNDREPNGQDFDMVGEATWLAIAPPAALNMPNRNVDLRISKGKEGFRIEIYYFDDVLGADTTIDSISYTWEELEAAWQATLTKDSALNHAQKAAIAHVLEIKERIKTLENNLAFAEQNLTRHHAPFHAGDTIRISQRRYRKITSPDRGTYQVISITPVVSDNPRTALRWDVRLSNAEINAPYYLDEYAHGWSFGPNHICTILPAETAA